MKRNLFLFLTLLLVSIAAKAVNDYDVESRYIVSPAKVTVAVPADYATAGNTATYPVVYMLNGHGGNNRSWSTVIDLDSLATANRVIIVCPDGRNSWYWDSPIDPKMQMESYITKELVPWVDNHYRTRTNRDGRAITGFSMGGHGALWIAFRHPDLFANVGATSGGVDIRPFPSKWDMAKRLGPYNKNRKRWNNHTIATLVEKVKPGKYNIIFDCGTEDFFYQVNCNLDKAMTRRGIEHTFLTSAGAHTSSYWHRSIQPQMKFFETLFYPAQ